jgi:lauroyl/myristoyl acyltransferase
MSRDVLSGHPRLRLLLYRSKSLIANACPLWLGRTLAYAVGMVLWALDAGGRKVVRRNLAHFIPARCPEALARAVRRNYISFSMYIYESFRLHRLPQQFFQSPQLTLVDPFGVFRERPLRTPAILVTVHSNWELIAAVIHRLGLVEQVEVIALTSGDRAIDALFERMRNAVGAHSLSLDHAPLGALRALRAGKILGVVGDRDYTGNGLRVPFAGEMMALPLGPAALAVQTHAPIIPLYLGRRSSTSFTLVVGRPIHADASKPKASQVTSLTSCLAKVMARFIATAPAQWISFHDAWKRVP